MRTAPPPQLLLGVAAAILAAAISTSSCGGQSSPTTPSPSTVPPSPVASATVNVTFLSIQVGQRLQLTATARDAAGILLTGRIVSWSSSDPSAASVSSTGLVEAIGGGSATVTATVEGVAASAQIAVVTQSVPQFNLSRQILGTPTLSASVQSVDVAAGQVIITGFDDRRPRSPFTFDWGDGTFTNGFFNQRHTYRDVSRGYTVRVTAHYSAVETDYFDLAVRFRAPAIVPTPFPAELTVGFPNPVPTLASRQLGYAPSAAFLPFDDSFFGITLAKADAEYILSQAAALEFAILEADVERVGSEFRQVVLRDPNFSGAYSLWYTTPVAFGAAGSFLQGTPSYSSLFHEMAHNLSLNSPASFRYGGRTDGAANAVFSEAVAQMFQHAVSYEMVNNPARYGLPNDLVVEIANSARSSALVTRRGFEDYVAQGKPFSTWNAPETPVDETFGTFMTLSRQFLVHAEAAQSYVVPLARTMRLLRTFDQDTLTQYAPRTDSAVASSFRATLMVAALSYGFRKDLRDEFRELNFPVDDSTYTKLMQRIP